MPDPANKTSNLKNSQRGGKRSLSTLNVSILYSASFVAAFGLTFSVLLTVFFFAMNQILRQLCGTKLRAVVAASAVLFAASAKVLLTNRVRWCFPMGATGAALIIAAAAYGIPYLVAAICYAVISGA